MRAYSGHSTIGGQVMGQGLLRFTDRWSITRADLTRNPMPTLNHKRFRASPLH